jgi:hypothetical protein
VFFETVDARSPNLDRLEQITTNMGTIHDSAANTQSEYVPYDYKSIHTDILNAMPYIRLAGSSIDYLANGGEGFEHYLTLDVYKEDTQKVYDNAEILQQSMMSIFNLYKKQDIIKSATVTYNPNPVAEHRQIPGCDSALLFKFSEF